MAIDYTKLLSQNHPEIELTCLGDASNYNNITFIGGSIDQATLDSEYLTYYKHQKNMLIDEKTKELILSGFTYDGVVFSTSETAQRNWMALDQFKGFHTYPVAVTADDDSEYTFPDSAEVQTFVLTGMGAINSHYASGRTLKLSVNAATDIAGVDAVADNR